MRKGTAPPGSGMAKIEKFCQLAAARRFDWAWIDTCCIDKRSSAELSEAINAMFKWYKHSEECYVYLSDVEYYSHELADGWPSRSAKFRQSSWFTRGWTLQELLAPQKSKVLFFDANWNEIGSLPQLAKDVSDITGIEEFYVGYKQYEQSHTFIHGVLSIADASVAKRMSWASRRQTSREEDMAYCLLGLFDVNMSLLYGEGAKGAFYRLQIEIMRKMDDESLFAWTSDQEISGMLASSPSFFAHSGNISRGWKYARRPYSMTNKGLEFPVPQEGIAIGGKRGYIRVFLDCIRDGEEEVPLALCLQQVGGFCAFRTRCDRVDAVRLWSDSMDFTLDRLYHGLQDPRSIYVFDPHDGNGKRQLIHHVPSENNSLLTRWLAALLI